MHLLVATVFPPSFPKPKHYRGMLKTDSQENRDSLSTDSKEIHTGHKIDFYFPFCNGECAHVWAINGWAMENAMEKNIQHVPSSYKADIWAHFGLYNIDGKKELDKTYVICELCKAKVKYFGNTTKLRTHVTRHHPEDANKVQSKVRNTCYNTYSQM